MKRFVSILIAVLCMTNISKAQTYLQHLQQKTPGLGTVTVSQSKAIDELVNGKTPAPTTQDNKTTPSTKNNTKSSDVQKRNTPDSLKKSEHHETTTEREKVVVRENSAKKAETEKEENETPTVDMRKKVMRGSYKVTGYRVQAYAGGNSRNDRLKAEQIGNAIKMKFPDQPVYVHFYSPRWICRVGNYRSQAEAQKMLTKIHAMGYKQACLVKGKITVQY